MELTTLAFPVTDEKSATKTAIEDRILLPLIVFTVFRAKKMDLLLSRDEKRLLISAVVVWRSSSL
jgi:hypothetical protein